VRRVLRALAAGAALAAPVPAAAGPPFLTDDPEPTDTGHWEIYAPALEASGRGADHEGALGAELNYGAAPDVQLSLGLPVAYAHDRSGYRVGAGDLELSAKYRFYHDEAAGLSLAAFPGITLPTARRGLGNPRVTAFLPLWAQKDAGPWSVFGGGGYAINPGPGARNYWTGGLAVTRQVSQRLLIGLEATRAGSQAAGEGGETSLGLGAILDLGGPFRLLASGGPTFVDHGGAASFHAFVALGVDF
jgi:hypothetical protein